MKNAMKRIFACLLVLMIQINGIMPIVLARGEATDTPAQTENQVTQSPEPTEAPVTEAPVTEAPVTVAPITEAPVTVAPTAEKQATTAAATETTAVETAKPTEQAVSEPKKEEGSNQTPSEQGSSENHTKESLTPLSSSLRLTDYVFVDDNDLRITTVQKGDKVNLLLTFEDSVVLTKQISGVNALQIQKHADSFQYIVNTNENPAYDGVPKVELLSGENSSLRFRVRLPHMEYSGIEKTLDLSVSYSIAGLAPVRITERRLAECVVSEEQASSQNPTTGSEGAANPVSDGTNTAEDKPGQTPPKGNETPENVVNGIISVAGPADPLTNPAPDITLSFASSVAGETAPSADAPKALNNAEPEAPAIADGDMVRGLRGAPPAPQQNPPLPQGTGTNQPESAETEKPQATEKPATSGAESASVHQPLLVITRTELAPVAPGQAFSMNVVFKNLGTTDVETPVAVFTPSEGLTLNEKTPSFVLEKIAPQGEYSMRLNLKALDAINTPTLFVDTLLKFSYTHDGQMVAGTQTEKLLIPVALKTKEASRALVQMGRTDLPTPIAADSQYTVTLWFKNVGGTTLLSPMATVVTSDALVFMENSSSFLLPDIKPGEVVSKNIVIQTTKEIQSPQQYLQLDLKYEYVTDKGVEKASSTERVMMPSEVRLKKVGGGGSAKAKVEPSIPYLVVSRYDFGAGQVAAGAEFNLTLSMKNTSDKQRVENVVVTLETSESLSITSSSNTLYITGFNPGEEQTTMIKVKALGAAKNEPAKIDISFKYEFTDGEKRSSVTASGKIFVPIYQPDRMNISPPTVPEVVNVGQETTISIAYINKGKSEAANLSAKIEGEIPSLSKVLNIGNIESGKSGSIDFIVTPDHAGKTEFTVVVTYENANQQTITENYPIKLNVIEPEPANTGVDLEHPDGEEKTSDTTISPAVYGLGGVAALGVGGLVLSKLRKKKKLKNNGMEFSFDDEGPKEPPSRA